MKLVFAIATLVMAIQGYALESTTRKPASVNDIVIEEDGSGDVYLYVTKDIKVKDVVVDIDLSIAKDLYINIAKNEEPYKRGKLSVTSLGNIDCSYDNTLTESLQYRCEVHGGLELDDDQNVVVKVKGMPSAKYIYSTLQAIEKTEKLDLGEDPMIYLLSRKQSKNLFCEKHVVGRGNPQFHCSLILREKL
jgi:D-serine dehydratase